MKKTKLLSLLLCLSLVCTLFVSGTTAFAESESDPDDGMVVNKMAEVIDEKGTTRITLEAFATGSQTTSTVHKDIPTDIILVLDQSGSMKQKMGEVKYSEYGKKDATNTKNYERRHNGGSANLWYKLSDGSYVSVSVTKTTTYRELKKLPNYVFSGESYWKYKDNLYEKVGNEYKKVTVIDTGDFISGYTYTYTFSDGKTVVSDGNSTEPDFGNRGPLYTPNADNKDTVYTYTYKDAAGTHTISSSTGVNTQYNPPFYKRTVDTSVGVTRLEALKNAVTAFADDVAKRAAGKDENINTMADNVNHRIAVVGYSTKASNLTNGLVAMDDSVGLSTVKNAVNGLSASGDTYPAEGLNIANKILNDNPVPNGQQRNRVIVMFTDGYPAESGTDNINYDLCDNAVASAYSSKKTYGATVYTVGIFDGADPTSDIDSNFEYGNRRDAANRYMHYTSTNFENAQSMRNGGDASHNGFYLSANNADALNSIFKQISSNIPSGGSATTLGSDAVVKDIISPYFKLPADATTNDIDIKTYKCTKVDGGKYEWSNTGETPSDVSAKIEDDTVSVTGFNFSENWCGEEKTNGVTKYRGNKLVITFTVQPKAGFLGGNGVPTNTSAGIYEDANAKDPVKTFPVPYVHVPIKPVTVTAVDKNVYLMGDVTEAECKNGATAECGTVKLNLNAANYGLEEWQTKFVEITTTVKDKDGNAIPAGGLQNLTKDTTYTFTATVAPKPANLPDGVNANGTEATAQRESAIGKINVFKPELTFKDTEAYYGDTAPDYTKNLVESATKWTHNETEAVPATMIGDAPKLDITYAPEADKIDANGKINTPNDFGVKATVKIGNTDVTILHTTFVHTNCTGKTCTLPEGYQFLIHVKTCTLTVKKVVEGSADAGQRFIFKVTSPNGFDQTVVVGAGQSVTITGLKVGEYKVIEDTAWSWRYEAQGGQEKTATLSAGQNNDTKTVTVTNTRDKNQWVTTDVYCKNVFTKDAKPEIVNDTPTTN